MHEPISKSCGPPAEQLSSRASPVAMAKPLHDLPTKSTTSPLFPATSSKCRSISVSALAEILKCCAPASNACPRHWMHSRYRKRHTMTSDSRTHAMDDGDSREY